MKTTKEEDKILELARKAGKRYMLMLLPPGSNPDTQKGHALAELLGADFRLGMLFGRLKRKCEDPQKGKK